MPSSVRHASERRALAKDRAEIDARAVEVADMLAKLERERAEFEEHRAAAKIAAAALVCCLQSFCGCCNCAALRPSLVSFTHRMLC